MNAQANREKLTKAERARQRLMAHHNATGLKYIQGKLNLRQWRAYLAKQYNPADLTISNDILSVRKDVTDAANVQKPKPKKAK